MAYITLNLFGKEYDFECYRDEDNLFCVSLRAEEGFIYDQASDKNYEEAFAEVLFIFCRYWYKKYRKDFGSEFIDQSVKEIEDSSYDKN